MNHSFLDAIRRHARRAPRSPALLAPGCDPLDYAGLLAGIEATVADLRARGIGRGDPVALVLPNGPGMAAAFLGVASAAAAAPLNPGYTETEFAFFLSDLRPRLLVLGGEGESPASAAARSLGIPVLRAQDLPGTPAGNPVPDASPPGPADTALLLHTSGTTSRPKLVPLLHANLALSARNIAASLALTPGDRCLNVMPLFHIHGLVGALLSSLHAGASVVCTPGFLAPRVPGWVGEFLPTWITAVPTMLQSILERVGPEGGGLRPSSLRFLRSSSAALPPRVALGLEEALGIPVIEAYGMTEASHQMAVNPMPPGVRKPGSVGLPAGPEIAVLDGEGRPVPPGGTGEIAIRGETVTPGYVADPGANGRAFRGGWFLTGDLGTFDGDGYLYVNGRTKELINRGGEKISPREVEEALRDHPSVAQAACFGIPHPTLGEEVGAAVVPAAGAVVAESELRRFASARLAPFKVPRRIVVLPDLPRGPTGKVQRVGMAARLGLAGEPPAGESAPAFAAPATPVETRLAEILGDVLRMEPGRIARPHRFEDLGLDSMLALAFLSRIRDALGAELVLLDLLDHPSLAALAGRIGGAPHR